MVLLSARHTARQMSINSISTVSFAPSLKAGHGQHAHVFFCYLWYDLQTTAPALTRIIGPSACATSSMPRSRSRSRERSSHRDRHHERPKSDRHGHSQRSSTRDRDRDRYKSERHDTHDRRSHLTSDNGQGDRCHALVFLTSSLQFGFAERWFTAFAGTVWTLLTAAEMRAAGDQTNTRVVEPVHKYRCETLVSMPVRTQEMYQLLCHCAGSVLQTGLFSQRRR